MKIRRQHHTVRYPAVVGQLQIRWFLLQVPTDDTVTSIVAPLLLGVYSVTSAFWRKIASMLQVLNSQESHKQKNPVRRSSST